MDANIEDPDFDPTTEDGRRDINEEEDLLLRQKDNEDRDNWFRRLRGYPKKAGSLLYERAQSLLKANSKGYSRLNQEEEDLEMERLDRKEVEEEIKRKINELYPQFSSKVKPRVGFRQVTTKEGDEIVEAKLWGDSDSDDNWVGIEDIDNIPPKMKAYLGPTQEEVGEWGRISNRMKNEFPRNTIPEEPREGWGLREEGKDKDGYPIVMIKVPGDDKYKKIHTKKGETSMKLSGKVRGILGKERDVILAENDKKVETLNKEKEELITKGAANSEVIENDGGSTKAAAEVENAQIDKELAKINEEINETQNESDNIRDKMTIRERVKEIFKKYGFTATAIIASIGVVIGVIVSNLKSGLGKVAKGMGNGLKELGKKLGQILPGIAGAIASFIFKTAGEVVGFLGKHAWLLIVGFVLLAIDQFKGRRSSNKK